MKGRSKTGGAPELAVPALIQSAVSLMLSGQLDQAAALCAQALAKAPSSADAAFVMGAIKAQARKFAEALDHLDRALALNPDDGEIRGVRATVMAQLLQGRVATAVGLHQGGRLDEAEAIYEDVLQRDPQNFDAWQLLGAVAVQRGQPAKALDCLDHALALNGEHAETHNNRGNALQDIGRLDEALASYDRALALRPDNPEAHNNRGNALRCLRRATEALASYDRALACKPDYAEAHNNRGNTLLDLACFDDALAAYDRALALRPDYPEAWNNRGNALRRLGRLDEALASFDRALDLGPDYLEAYSNRGNVLRDMRRFNDALASYDAALARDQDFAEALSNRGNVLRDLGCLDEALVSIERAIAVAPEFVEAHVNRGNVLREHNRFDESLASYDRALSITPDHIEALTNRGNVLHALRRSEEALASYAKALAVRPDYAEAHWNEALVRLSLGDYAVGWQKYEWRWRIETYREKPRHHEKPLWLGREPVRGKAVLLWAEQGLGDTIQFCRFAKRVAEIGAAVILEAPRPLLPVLNSLRGVSVLVGEGDPLPDYDYQCPLLSVPQAIGLRPEDISGEPYLAAPAGPGLALGDARHRPKIGVVWSGNLSNRSGLHRSLTCHEFLQCLPEGLDAICLQKEISDADRAALAHRSDVRTIDDRLGDFGDTAAVIAGLDLVITIDTSVAHLAGALGKEVWILLSATADWRWLHDRDDSPWYGLATLIRQRKPGDWMDVLDSVRRRLCERYGECGTSQIPITSSSP